MIAGSLEIQLMADVARLRADMDKAQSIVTSASRAMQKAADEAKQALAGIVPTMGVAGLVAFVKTTIDAAANLRDLSVQAGMSVESLSALVAVGKATSTGADAIASSSNKLSKSLATSTEESKGAAAALKALGLNFDQFQKLTPDQRIQQVAVAMGMFRDGAQKSAAAMLLFGKAGAEMLPFLKDLAQTGTLHAKITEDQAEAAHRYEVALGKLKVQADAWKKQLALELLPTLDAITQELLNMKAASSDPKGPSLLGETLKTVFETIAVLGVNVVYVLRQMGNELGGIAAQAAAILTLNWGRVPEIRKEMVSDAAAARRQVDQQSSNLLGITNSRAGAGRGAFPDPRVLGAVPDFHRDLTGLEGNGHGEDGAKQYDALIKRIKERLELQKEEITRGRELTDQEKFDAKTRTDLAELMAKFPGLSKGVVDGLLAQSDAHARALEARKEDIKAIKELNKFLIDQDADLAADAKARADERNRVYQGISDTRRQLEDSNRMLQAEGQLMGLNDRDRAVALEKLRIELDLKREIEKINQNLLLGEQERSKAIADATDNANLAKMQAELRAQIDVWHQVDDAARDFFHNMFEGGDNAFKKLGASLKRWFIDLLYEMTVKRWVVNLATSVTGGGGGGVGGLNLSSLASLFTGGSGGGGSVPASGGLGNIGTLGAIGSKLAGLFGGGGAAATTSTGLGLLGGDVGSSLAAGGASGGVGAMGASFAGVPVVGWIAAAMMASGSLYDKGYKWDAGSNGFGGNTWADPGMSINTKALGAFGIKGKTAAILTGSSILQAALQKLGIGGETRSGGQYSNADFLAGPSGGEIAGDDARKAIQSTIESTNALIKSLGGTATIDTLYSGLESSRKGKGFAYAGAMLTDGTVVGQGADGKGYLNRRGDKDAKQAFADFSEELKQVTLQALQASGVDEALGKYLRDLGDIDKLSGGALDAALERLGKIQTERVNLEDKIFALTATSTEQLARAREQERAAIDETNYAMLDRLHNLQAEKQAADTLAVAIDAVSKVQVDYKASIGSTNQTIRQYLDRLNATDAALASPESQLAAAKSQFQMQLQLARGGDRTAREGITQYADQLIHAQIGYSASGGDTGAVIADVKRQLESLPDMVSAQDYLAEVLKQTSTDQVEATKAAADKIWAGLWGSAGLLSTKFDIVDRDVNGLLDFGELKAAIGPLASDATLHALIAQADADGDGQLSRLEIINASLWNTAAQQVAVQQQTQQVIASTSTAVVAATQATAAAVNTFTNWVGNYGGGYSPGDSGAAQGAAFSLGKWLPFATGGAFTNSIVARPTLFPIGLMGEAGDEAIMPLTRTRSGDLGVRQEGGGETAKEIRALREEVRNLTAVTAAAARGTISRLGDMADSTAATARSAALRASEARVSS